MKILLTMAGLGSRFKNAGYTEEKYAIVFRGRTLLEWSLASLLSFRDSELILITRAFEGIEEDLPVLANKLGFENHRVIVIDRMTRGQAETAILAAPAFEEDEDILIFNTDTYIDPSTMRPQDIQGAGWIPTFHAPGDKWSFVDADETGLARRTTEKQRISDDCSVGVYYFNSFEGFKALVDEAADDGELYVAPLYNRWIAQNKPTYLYRLPEAAVTVLGTPEDLEVAEQRNRPIWPEDCL